MARLSIYRVKRDIVDSSCVLCDLGIHIGESAHDGGPNRRAHVNCVAAWKDHGSTESWPTSRRSNLNSALNLDYDYYEDAYNDCCDEGYDEGYDDDESDYL